MWKTSLFQIAYNHSLLRSLSLYFVYFGIPQKTHWIFCSISLLPSSPSLPPSSSCRRSRIETWVQFSRFKQLSNLCFSSRLLLPLMVLCSNFYQGFGYLKLTLGSLSSKIFFWLLLHSLYFNSTSYREKMNLLLSNPLKETPSAPYPIWTYKILS